MAQIIQIRRDTAANWTSVNPILAQGEMGYETDNKKIKFGDGVTAWSSLAYFTLDGGGGSALKGTAVVNFGSTPTNYATVTVSNANIIAATSQIILSMSNTATATHSVDEHAIAPIRLVAGNLIDATSFDIIAVSEWGLTGTFNVFYQII
jgi:hypothetical protein